MLGLVGNVDQARHAGLHPERHFVLADPRRDFRIIDQAVAEPVELLDGVDDVALTGAVDARGILDVEHRVALGVKVHALESARQEAAVPLP